MKLSKPLSLALLLAIIAVFTGITAFSPQDEQKGYATVSIYENFSVVNSMIIITYPDETTEVIDLGPFKYNADYLQDNGKTINTALNSMREKGYRVVSTSSSGKINSNKAMRITTVIMEN
ncbi:MAG: hypothetical protein R6T99_05205 [Bacteroidales bacterium]